MFNFQPESFLIVYRANHLQLYFLIKKLFSLMFSQTQLYASTKHHLCCKLVCAQHITSPCLNLAFAERHRRANFDQNQWMPSPRFKLIVIFTSIDLSCKQLLINQNLSSPEQSYSRSSLDFRRLLHSHLRNSDHSFSLSESQRLTSCSLIETREDQAAWKKLGAACARS